jgi:predicted metalloprotease
MNALIRPGLLAAGVVAVGLGVAGLHGGSAKADATPAGHNLTVGDKGSAQPQTMEDFLTRVTKDVDAYWTQEFKDAGRAEPRVTYDWIPAGETASSVCGDENGQLGDSAAAYCPGDDTIYISQRFATEIYNGQLDQSLPGSAQGYGDASGDMAVAYIVAHEYGHEVQAELGLFDKYGQLPTMAFELQADCYAGTWANYENQQGRLEDGDVDEALNAALAVGDFDASNPGHHGTPEQRKAAWEAGFDAGDPSACDTYLDPASLGDGGATQQEDPTQQQDPYGDPTQQQDPYGYPQEDPGFGPYGAAA